MNEKKSVGELIGSLAIVNVTDFKSYLSTTSSNFFGV